MEDQQLIQLAIKHAYLTDEQLARAKREQQLLADRGIERSLWFMVQDLGLIRDAQTRELRKFISSSRINALEVEGYVIEGRIGSGGMGDVFKARNAEGREVAIKLLSSKFSSDPEYARRFQREARATILLNHPHITHSLSTGEISGQRYLVMELVTGPSLREYITKYGPIGEDQGMVLLAQMAEALRYAWSKGVLHRDVKPANIILGHPRPGIPEPFCAKLCDFGLAKTWQEGAEGTATYAHGELTHSGVALGTPHYMSPEQASGERDLDQRCDIYSLGASLYHALLGQTLYNGKSSAVIMYKQVTEIIDLGPLAERGIAPSLLRLLNDMLAKSKNRRIGTWEEILSRLHGLSPIALPVVRIEGVDGSRPLRSAAASNPRQHRLNLIRTAAVAMVVAMVVVAAGLAFLRHHHEGLIQATPATLSRILGQLSDRADAAEIELAPGDYQGPWAFGVGQNQMTIHAGGALVRLVGTPPGEPCIRLLPGLRDFHLQGVTILADGRLAIEALSGASASLSDLTIPGSPQGILEDHGAQITISGLTVTAADHGIDLGPGSSLVLERAMVRSQVPVISSHQADLTLDRCRLQARSPGETLVDETGGTLHISAVIGEAGGCSTALRIDEVVSGSVVDLALRGSRVGFDGQASHLDLVDGLTIDADETALEWSGPAPAAGSWRHCILRAPRPVIGHIPAGLATGATGANGTRLRAVPSSVP